MTIIVQKLIQLAAQFLSLSMAIVEVELQHMM